MTPCHPMYVCTACRYFGAVDRYSTALCHMAACQGHLNSLRFMLESHGGQAVFGPVELKVTMELLASEEWQSDCYASDCMTDGECAYTLMDQATQTGSVEVARWLHEAHGAAVHRRHNSAGADGPRAHAAVVA
jgi:hypothetical protein